MEDIQGLAAIGKKAPKPQFMATYYAKLTRIFTVSDSHLYNGCAPATPSIHWSPGSVCADVTSAVTGDVPPHDHVCMPQCNK